MVWLGFSSWLLSGPFEVFLSGFSFLLCFCFSFFVFTLFNIYVYILLSVAMFKAILFTSQFAIDLMNFVRLNVYIATAVAV